MILGGFAAVLISVKTSVVANALSQASLSCGPGCRDCPGDGAGRFQTFASSSWARITNCTLGCLVCLLGFQSAEPDRQLFYWLIFKPWVSSDPKSRLGSELKSLLTAKNITLQQTSNTILVGYCKKWLLLCPG